MTVWSFYVRIGQKLKKQNKNPDTQQVTGPFIRPWNLKLAKKIFEDCLQKDRETRYYEEALASGVHVKQSWTDGDSCVQSAPGRSPSFFFGTRGLKSKINGESVQKREPFDTVGGE